MRRVVSNTSRLVLAFFTLLAFIALPASAEQENSAGSSNYLYVGSYIGQYPTFIDYISGYTVAADGSLQPLSGFPVSGPSFGLLSVGNFVFGNDGHDIETYARGSNGTLTPPSRIDEYTYAPQSAGMGIYALNPDRSGRTLTTVLSCGSCNSYVLPFSIGSNGQLSYIGGSQPPTLGAAKWNGVFTFSPDNRWAYTAYWQSLPTEYRRQPNGLLTYVRDGAASPPNDQVCLPGDMAVSASAGYIPMIWSAGLYCGQDGAYAMATYTVASDGSLALVDNSAFTPQLQEVNLSFDPTGTYLAMAGYVGNNGPQQAALQIYKLQSNGSLSPVGNMLVNSAASQFESVSWDSANHLYVVSYDCQAGCQSSFTNSVYIYNFDGQTLTPAPGSPHRMINVVGLATVPAS